MLRPTGFHTLQLTKMKAMIRSWTGTRWRNVTHGLRTGQPGSLDASPWGRPRMRRGLEFSDFGPLAKLTLTELSEQLAGGDHFALLAKIHGKDRGTITSTELEPDVSLLAQTACS